MIFTFTIRKEAAVTRANSKCRDDMFGMEYTNCWWMLYTQETEYHSMNPSQVEYPQEFPCNVLSTYPSTAGLVCEEPLRFWIFNSYGSTGSFSSCSIRSISSDEAVHGWIAMESTL
ncbi:unnamed protein product, partial [Nesidiocoris tenuis]